MPELDEVTLTTSSHNTSTLRDYVDKLISRQSTLIEASIRSQRAINSENMERRYKKYTCKDIPTIGRKVTAVHDAFDIDKPKVIKKLKKIVNKINTCNRRSPRLISLNALKTWIKDDTSESTHWHLNTPSNLMEDDVSASVDPCVIKAKTLELHDFDVQRMIHTKGFQLNDYVLRTHPPSKASTGPPDKYAAYWRGPYKVVGKLDDNRYDVLNIVSMLFTTVHVKHLKDFIYDPKRTNPLNIAIKETDEFVVENIVDHRVADDGRMNWKVRWEGYGEDRDTWEPTSYIAHVGKFHEYCLRTPKLIKYLPREIKRDRVKVKKNN